jgi:hypothetical protein
MPIRVKNCGEGHNWGSTEAVNNMVGVSLLVLNIQVELLQVCGPFLMVVIM